MRKIREVLRLKWVLSLSHRQVECSVRLGHGTVGDYLRRAKLAGLCWEEAERLSDGELERRLFPSACGPPVGGKAEPDWRVIQKELKGKGVTLSLLWQEYREGEPEGYGYSRFCELFRSWQGRLDAVLRQDYRGGEMLFVDYAGQAVPIVNRETGEVSEAQIFVAALGASNYTFRSDGESDPGGLDRLACALLRVPGWRARAGGAGQSEERGDEAVPLRPGAQPQLR
jgi:hypothetical protein